MCDREAAQHHPWHIPFESPWAVLHKVALFNRISLYSLGKHIAKGLCRRNGGRATRWNRVRLDDWLAHTAAYEDLAAVLKYVPAPTLRQSFLSALVPQQDQSYWIARNELRICPECVQRGYHSAFHQFRCIDVCPIHGIPLREECPNCQKAMPVAADQGEPFECPHCNHRLWLPYPRSIQRERLNVLRLEPAQKERLENLYEVLLKSFRSGRSLLPSCIGALGEFGRQPRWLSAKMWASLDLRGTAVAIGLPDRAPTSVSRSTFASPAPPCTTKLNGNATEKISCFAIYKAVKRHLKQAVLGSRHRKCCAGVERAIWWEADEEDRWPMCPHGMAFFLWRRRWEFLGRRSGLRTTPFSVSPPNLSARDRWAWASVVARAYYWTFWEALTAAEGMAANGMFSWDCQSIRGRYIPVWSITETPDGAEISWGHECGTLGLSSLFSAPPNDSGRGHRQKVDLQLSAIRR